MCNCDIKFGLLIHFYVAPLIGFLSFKQIIEIYFLSLNFGSTYTSLSSDFVLNFSKMKLNFF